MKHKCPTISVIIPCFNNETTITRCLRSVLDQTQKASEILVYDDASRDRTADIVNDISCHHPVVKLFRGTENRGAGYARALLLDRCKGEFLAFIDADDYWHPSKLELQIAAFDDPSVGICVTDFEIVRNGKLIGTRRAGHRITFTSMLISNRIGMSTAMLRGSLMFARDMPSFRKRQDYAYWLRLLRNNKDMRVASVPQFLVYYERREKSISSDKIDNIRWNYKVFRSIGANKLAAAFLVILNTAVRLVRS